jgi:hypothetical protein
MASMSNPRTKRRNALNMEHSAEGRAANHETDEKITDDKEPARGGPSPRPRSRSPPCRRTKRRPLNQMRSTCGKSVRIAGAPSPGGRTRRGCARRAGAVISVPQADAVNQSAAVYRGETRSPVTRVSPSSSR